MGNDWTSAFRYNMGTRQTSTVDAASWIADWADRIHESGSMVISFPDHPYITPKHY